MYSECNRMLGLPRFCSASGMFADARTDYFHNTLRKRCASLVRRVRDSSKIVLQMIAARTVIPSGIAMSGTLQYQCR
ncbi:jg14965 [Pararge aegeria aegeria]|uniref:Jg14965 protein n=1 Tax=Pararge aegeria aegeria TaxID=348720 RepID=A0A8S4SH21_9NEOP|nr:jg14965 [Pararge aegeria aegeria]